MALIKERVYKIRIFEVEPTFVRDGPLSDLRFTLTDFPVRAGCQRESEIRRFDLIARVDSS